MDPVEHYTGRAIRTLRKTQGLSLRELARLADVNAGYLSKIERGMQDPSPRLLKNITDALGRNMAGVA